MTSSTLPTGPAARGAGRTVMARSPYYRRGHPGVRRHGRLRQGRQVVHAEGRVDSELAAEHHGDARGLMRVPGPGELEPICLVSEEAARAFADIVVRTHDGIGVSSTMYEPGLVGARDRSARVERVLAAVHPCFCVVFGQGPRATAALRSIPVRLTLRQNGVFRYVRFPI